MKIRKWKWRVEKYCDPLDMTINRYLLGREVGFDGLDYNRARLKKKNCILDYKLMMWSYKEPT